MEIRAPEHLRTNREGFTADAIAGLTFAVVNIPQGMANALLAGVNPVLGLYTLMVATPVAALTTSSVFMNVSTTSALSVATADVLNAYPAAQRLERLAGLVLLVGLVQLVLGVFRLGSLLRVVSNSVMVGFITGVAALIILGQAQDLTGYDSAFGNKVFQLLDVLLHPGQYDWPTFIIGILTIGLIVLLARTRLNRVAMVVALLVSTVAVALFDLDAVAVVGDTSELPDQLLNFSFPNLSSLVGLLPSALALAIIGLVQGAGVSKSYPNPDGNYPDNSRDFAGQGLANVATSFLQGIPAGGSMSGTAVTYNAGAKSRWANILGGLLILPLVLLLDDLILLLPMSALAGLLIVVGWQSFKPEDVLSVWTTGLVPRAAMMLTFLATLFIPLQFAVFIGVAMTVLLSVFNASNKVELVQFIPVENGFPIETEPPDVLPSGEITLLYVYGSLFFAATSRFEDQLPGLNGSDRAVVVLSLRRRADIGNTLITVLERYTAALQEHHGRLYLAGVHPHVREQLIRTGVAAKMGEDTIFLAEPQLGASMNNAISAARVWLDEPLPGEVIEK